MTRFGIVGAVIVYYDKDGNKRMLDGHLRQGLAQDDMLPCLMTDLTEEEADQLIVLFDKSGELAEWDLELVKAAAEKMDFKASPDLKLAFDPKLLEEVTGEKQKSMNQETADRKRDEAEGEGFLEEDDWEGVRPGDEQGIAILNPEAVFSSSNPWGIPDYDTEMLGTVIPRKVWTKHPDDNPQETEDALFIYGNFSAKTMIAESVLCFYAQDEVFDKIWNKPVEAIGEIVNDCRLRNRWKNIISPDFSTWRDKPLIVQFFEYYKSRWVARYLQETGIPVIPNLSWSDERTYKLMFETVPKEAPVVSVQCRTSRDDQGKDLFHQGLHAAIKCIQPQNVLLYGGAEHYNWFEKTPLPRGPEYHFYYSFRTLIGNQRDNQLNRSLGYPGVRQS